MSECRLPAVVYSKEIQVGKRIKHWSKLLAVLEQEGPVTCGYQADGRHLLVPYATAASLPPPFLFGRKRREIELVWLPSVLGESHPRW